MVEIKTGIVDGQDLLGALDVKARVAPRVARDLGWHARVCVPMIVVADGTTARRHLAAMSGLLSRYGLRGRDAVRWLREPIGTPTGLLILTKLPSNAGNDARRAGRRRVRRKKANCLSAARFTTPTAQDGNFATLPPAYISPSNGGCGMRSGLSAR